MSDAYRTVDVQIRSVLPNVIYVDRPRSHGIVTIARSLIHYRNDQELNGLPRGAINAAMTLRLRDWKAEELGFAG